MNVNSYGEFDITQGSKKCKINLQVLSRNNVHTTTVTQYTRNKLYHACLQLTLNNPSHISQLICGTAVINMLSCVTDLSTHGETTGAYTTMVGKLERNQGVG